MSRERVWYFDFLRIFAMFAVVMVHVSAQHWYDTPTNSFEWNVFNVYDSLVRWGVPIFTMISGALFLSRDQKISKIFKKNILRLFIALMFWSTIYALLRVFTHKIDGLGEFILSVFKNNNTYLWFLYMLIGLYIITPLLRKIVKDKKLAIYFVVLSLIFAFLIPEIIHIIGFAYPSLAKNLRAIIDTFQIKFVMGYSGYFVLGYLLNEFRLKRKTENLIFVGGFLGLLFTILATAFISIHFGEERADFFDNLTINTLLVSVSVFLLAKRYLSKVNIKRKKLLLYISKSSFGVYLVHMLVLPVLAHLGLNTLSFNPIISVPVIAIIVFAISLAISMLLNKIPIIKKWIV